MAARILDGNVFDLLPTIPAGSVDCCVTSPPYWLLRSYLPKGHPLKPLELGSEPTPREYVENQVRVFRLVRDCLADHATCWLNVGDSYSNDPGNGRGALPERATLHKGGGNPHRSGGNKAKSGVPSGNLCLIPQRLAVALQDDGWIVRSVVVWHKPAPMPASLSGWAWRRCRVKVKPRKVRHSKTAFDEDRRKPSAYGDDWKSFASSEWSDCPGCKKCSPHGGYVLRRGSWRPTSSWEPVLMLAKTPSYFADGESVKQPPAAATVNRDQYTRVLDDPDEQFAVRHDHETLCDGANLRDVWTIAAEPLREKHYAAFPTELVHRCLKAGTSAKGYCRACGKPWVRVVEDTGQPRDMDRPQARRAVELFKERGLTEEHRLAIVSAGATDAGRAAAVQSGTGKNTDRVARLATEAKEALGGYYREFLLCGTKTLDWRPSCSCPNAEPRPGLVLDPFAGSGRTGLEAGRLGLDFVGCELNLEYAEMSRRLLREESPLFSEAPTPCPPPPA